SSTKMRYLDVCLLQLVIVNETETFLWYSSDLVSETEIRKDSSHFAIWSRRRADVRFRFGRGPALSMVSPTKKISPVSPKKAKTMFFPARGIKVDVGIIFEGL
ncbi:hypothetical protein TNIN_451411, partial [Trichonephila inaurata madagascariensis]